MDDQKDTSSASALAGGVGALIACCLVHVLIVAGLIGGLGGLAFGGLVAGIGLTVAAITWLIAWRLRKRRVCRTTTARPDQRRAGR